MVFWGILGASIFGGLFFAADDLGNRVANYSLAQGLHSYLETHGLKSDPLLGALPALFLVAFTGFVGGNILGCRLWMKSRRKSL